MKFAKKPSSAWKRHKKGNENRTRGCKMGLLLNADETNTSENRFSNS